MAGILKVDQVQSDSNLSFQVAGANVAYMNSTGLQMTGGTLSLAGTTIIPAVGQIKFPATQNASSDANTLDDYEEGTWTPTLGGSSGDPTGITYDGQYGYYVKIGKQVYVSCVVGWTTYTGGSNSIFIRGLPFTSETISAVWAGACQLEKLTWDTNYTMGTCRIFSNSTVIDIIESGSAQIWRGLYWTSSSSSATGKYIQASVTYSATA
jgi:hypothetical protein